jgi:hypothetical protein
MKRYTTVGLALALSAIAGCMDNPSSPPIDAPTVDALQTLTRRSLQQLALGVTAQDRVAFATTGELILPAIYARDVYRIDASEPRYVTETLGGQPDPGSFAAGGPAWSGHYTAIRAANTILILLRNADPTQFTTAEVAASRGFFRTMKALDYYRIVELKDTLGAAIQTDDPSAVTAIRCKPVVMDMIAALLDSANADFTAAGAGTLLPFTLPGGWQDTTATGRNYRQVANLVLFNRGLKGKVDFYRALNRQSPQPALFTTAIAELTQALEGAAPGAVSAAQQVKGVYYRFDPVEIANPRSDAKIGANPKVRDSVQAGDQRASKIVLRTDTISSGNGGISTGLTFSFAVASATNQRAPIALLRDEELVLLRAQAEIEAGQFANAVLDVNSVRNRYFAATDPNRSVTFTTQLAGRRAVLYEKRYSFLFEGPQRLVDLRAYGYLNQATLGAAAKETANDPFNSAEPFPRAELDARGLATGPACTP